MNPYLYHIAENFRWIKISPSPGTFVLRKYLMELQYGKGRHMLYVIINTRQKIRRTNFSPTRPGGEIGKNFLLTKISAIRYYVSTIP